VEKPYKETDIFVKLPATFLYTLLSCLLVSRREFYLHMRKTLKSCIICLDYRVLNIKIYTYIFISICMYMYIVKILIDVIVIMIIVLIVLMVSDIYVSEWVAL
jgi:hypothetical protein